MFASSIVSRYLDFYLEYALQKWDALTPSQYTATLVLIAVIGWFAMRGTSRR